MTHMLSEVPGISRDRLADEATWRRCRRGPSAATTGLSEALGVGQRQGSVCVWQVPWAPVWCPGWGRPQAGGHADHF